MYSNESECSYCELQALGESSELWLAIEGILETEVMRRVDKHISDYDAAKKDHAALHQQLAAQMAANMQLEREKAAMESKCEREIASVRKECDKAVEAVRADALIGMFAGYKENDKVFWIKDGPIYPACEKCGGKGKIEVDHDGEKLQAACNKCRGDGKIRLESGRHVMDARCRKVYASVDGKGNVLAVAEVGSYGETVPLSSLMPEDQAKAKVQAHNDALIKRYEEKQS